MKRQHRYRVTVERLETPDAAARLSTLRFEAAAHDEIIELAQRARLRGDFDTDTAAALTVGVKLLGEAMLQNREHPLFEAFLPHYGQFIKRLKEGAPPDPDKASTERPMGVLASCGRAVERLFDATRCY